MCAASSLPQHLSAGTLCAIVVTYDDRLDQLRRTLEQLCSVSHDYLTGIVIVDNASSDRTKNWLRKQTDLRIHIITSSSNQGGAGGFATGMEFCQQRYDPDWMVLMDDDGRPFNDTLEKFHQSSRTAAEAWAAAAYLPNGDICEINRPSCDPFRSPKVFWQTLVKGRNGFHLGPSDYESSKMRKVDGASFVGFFISRKGIRRAGLPQAKLFYGEDVIYALTLRAAGGKLLFDPQLRFEHDYQPAKPGGSELVPLWKTYYNYRSLLIAYRICAGPLFPLVAVAAACKWALRVRHHTGARKVFLRLLFRALRDGILHRLDVPHSDVRSWAEEGNEVCHRTSKFTTPEKPCLAKAHSGIHAANNSSGLI